MLVRIIMRNKKVVKILCVILAAAMPVSSGVGVQAAQAGAVAATADQTDDVQNAAETSAEDSAQNADSDDLEGSIQYLDDSAQTNNSDAQQDGNISSDQTPTAGWKATSDQASQDISGTIVQTRTAIMSQSRQVINRTLRLEQILMILKERRFFLLWALMRQICQIMMWSM